MTITIELSKNELEKLGELTDMEFDVNDIDEDDVSYAIGVLISNC